jgi:NitT/TauT family transport system substrate-binding protein
MNEASTRQGLSRREFLTAALGTAGGLAAGCMSPGATPTMPEPSASLGPAETATLLISVPPTCDAALFLAEPYLREEGITDVQFVKADAAQMTAGAADLVSLFPPGFAAEVDAGNPVVVLAGLHVGCIGLFAQKGTSSVRALRDKTVYVRQKDARQYTYSFLVVTLVEAGMDPARDVNIVEAPAGADLVRMFREGKADAVVTATTAMDKLRADGGFEMLVDYATDAPWSGHHCCLLTATRSFLDMRPNAARRAVRAIMRATIDTRTELPQAVRTMVDRGLTTDYDGTLAHDRTLPYESWRTVDPEVGIRFFAERLQRAGIIKSSADEIVRKGTDWSALRQAKRELKA